FMDNIVAFWVPASPPKPGESLEVNYRIRCLTNQVAPQNLGWVRSTRVGRVIEDPPKPQPNLRFVVDFDGPAMQALGATEQLRAEVDCGENAKYIADSLLKNEINGTWRLVMEITSPAKAVDLRAVL